MRLLAIELGAEGIISKVRRAADGSSYGAKPLARGALYGMLSNRIYRGEIVHKGNAFPGEHPAIIDEALWSEVQQILAANRVDRDTGLGAHEPSLLAGLVFDAQGERLTPTHAVKKGTRYRYYVSRSLISGTACADKKTERRDNGFRPSASRPSSKGAFVSSSPTRLRCLAQSRSLPLTRRSSGI